MLQQTTSLRAIAMCGVIVAGFFLGVDSEKSEADLDFTGQSPLAAAIRHPLALALAEAV